LLLVLLNALASGQTWAQAPFYTDDTATTAVGTVHVEAYDELDGLQSMQYPNLRQNTVNLKINVGLPHGLELDVDAPYLIIDRAAGTASSQGIGDTDLGVKWNIREARAGSKMPAVAVSLYTEFPTGNTHDELGSGVVDYWLNLIVQGPLTDSTRFNVNLGVLFAGNTSTGVVGIETKRGHVYTGGFSLMHDFTPRFTLGAEIYGGISDNSGVDRTQLQAMLGAQYAVSERVSVFCGLVTGTYSASPRVGGQIGFAIDFPNFFHSAQHAALATSKPPASERSAL
jgi:Putative MetA-pathway of phenol degradation